MLRRFQKPPLSLPKGQIPTAKHGPANRLYNRECHVLLYGWIQWI